jgi:hypothetical protein
MNHRSSLPISARNLRRRAKRRGFTLAELTVALLAGLIVAVSVVALSREATTTFQEEVRLSSAESQLRVAMDRLRADLQRASYMSTGNIKYDTMIYQKPPAPPPYLHPQGATYPLLFGLQGIHLWPGGSVKGTTVPNNLIGGTDDVDAFSVTNSRTPDVLDLSGNFTTTDEFTGDSMVDDAGGCSGQAIRLHSDQASFYRAWARGGGTETFLNKLFQPIANRPFIVRITDLDGHQQYAATCSGSAAVTLGPGPGGGAAASQVTLHLDGKILKPTAGGFGAGSFTVNPIQTVRWQIGQVAAPDPLANLNPDGDPGKFNLYRTFVDAKGNPAPVASSEMIAEYIVDLRFALTVCTDKPNCNGTLQSLAFTDPLNGVYAGDLGPVMGPTTDPGTSATPERVRGVTVQLAARAAIPDRHRDLPGLGGGLYRYCADPQNGCTEYARVRTLVEDVSLPNQAKMRY